VGSSPTAATMADFTFVTSRLATGGGIVTPGDVQAIIAAGITHVIDTRIEFNDAPLFEGTTVHYLWNGTSDDGHIKEPWWFSKSFAFALPALGTRKHKVHAHCQAGVNRGPSTALGIMVAQGFAVADAHDIIVAARPQVGLRYQDDAVSAVHRLGYA
jgi:hypothetical protein